MKQLVCLVAITFTVMNLGGKCWADDDGREENLRFKGTELYSWQDQGGEWVFSLAYGTNRLKHEEEIKSAKAQIKDIEDLKKSFARLAVGESVFWSHLIEGFEFPSEAMVEEIEKAAKEAEINLQIAPREKEPVAEPDASPDRGGR